MSNLDENPGYGWTIDKNIETCVHEALGAASMCWEYLDHAGVFDSTRAEAIGDALLKRIREGQPIYG